MKILYSTSEAVPFIKTGGLADVAGSLPIALKEKGNDVRVIMPLYSSISKEYKEKMKKICDFNVDLGWRRQYAGVFSYTYNDVIYYFIDNEYYFKRDKIYGEWDDGERFIFFSKVIALLPKILSFKPDIVHSNDWHTGLVPLYIKDFSKGDPFYKDIKTVFTIHNLKYQGVFPVGILEDVAGLPIEYYIDDGVKFYDNVNFMKAGIVYSDALTTVSNSYSEEIKYPYFGEQLDGIIRENEDKLVGIVNGIDCTKYDPATDKALSENYSIETLHKKKENKSALQKLFNLPQREDIPLIGMVSRLESMKGLDLVSHILDELLQEDIQFVLLGTGDKKYENMFNNFSEKYPDKLTSRIYFNEKEAHLIYAGSDIFLMPSMKEPCGISQLIALRYGSIPIVREVGGLKDTITHYSQYTGQGNGFNFKNFNAHDLLFTIKDALSLYTDREKWKRLMINAMNSKNDWEKSSIEYIELYNHTKDK
ncbi:glycogen synthase GlgA [Clostridium sp. D2Q-11]|uniref:Glycogen synthase n=1 Tax=Anaeromonas frigoriresistens TaxID=2683708 RepID=A0A942V1P0_9FIRM|nr:glycogen synthase GlgA [Anaeromonas frigoriresistens]MBS4538367.1 glycogen synthase GlgA [Anaeromonas frigoriresistens]